MGKPVTVAIIMVIAAPSATARRNSGDPATTSGTSPFPEKLFTSASAGNIEHTEPIKVVKVAHHMAFL